MDSELHRMQLCVSRCFGNFYWYTKTPFIGVSNYFLMGNDKSLIKICNYNKNVFSKHFMVLKNKHFIVDEHHFFIRNDLTLSFEALLI